jgi:cell division protein FtsW (lipid II flippase)
MSCRSFLSAASFSRERLARYDACMTVASVATSLNQSFGETVAIGLLLAAIVFVATLRRRLFGAIVLLIAALFAALLYLEFADPAMAGGIEIAFGAPLLRRLRILPFIVGTLSLIAFVLGECARTGRRNTLSRWRSAG